MVEWGKIDRRFMGHNDNQSIQRTDSDVSDPGAGLLRCNLSRVPGPGPLSRSPGVPSVRPPLEPEFSMRQRPSGQRVSNQVTTSHWTITSLAIESNSDPASRLVLLVSPCVLSRVSSRAGSRPLALLSQPWKLQLLHTTVHWRYLMLHVCAFFQTPIATGSGCGCSCLQLTIANCDNLTLYLLYTVHGTARPYVPTLVAIGTG